MLTISLWIFSSQRGRAPQGWPKHWPGLEWGRKRYLAVWVCPPTPQVRALAAIILLPSFQQRGWCNCLQARWSGGTTNLPLNVSVSSDMLLEHWFFCVYNVAVGSLRSFWVSEAEVFIAPNSISINVPWERRLRSEGLPCLKRAWHKHNLLCWASLTEQMRCSLVSWDDLSRHRFMVCGYRGF